LLQIFAAAGEQRIGARDWTPARPDVSGRPPAGADWPGRGLPRPRVPLRASARERAV